MKKVLSIILVAFLIMTYIPTFVLPVKSVTDNEIPKDMDYKIVDNEVTITKYTGSESVLKIPAEIDGYPVTSIGKEAFKVPYNYSCKIIDLYLPSSIKKIGEDAFRNCSELQTLHIESIESWCEIEFENYRSNPLPYANKLYVNEQYIRRFIMIPETVKTIKAYAFGCYYPIDHVYIPKSVERIEAYAFYEFEGIVSYTGTEKEWNKIASSEAINYEYEVQGRIIRYTDVGGITEDGWVYQIVNNEKVYLLNNVSDSTSLTIPSEMFGLPVYFSPYETTFDGSIYLETIYFNGSQERLKQLFEHGWNGGNFFNRYEFVYNYIPVEGIAPANGETGITINIGESINVDLELYPENANGAIDFIYQGDIISIKNRSVITGLKEGEATVKVTAESGASFTLTVNVIDNTEKLPECIGIYIANMPKKLHYSMRQSLDTTGLSIMKLYDDGSTVELDSTEYTLSGYNALIKGTHTITVEYDKTTVEFIVYISDAVVGDTDLDGILTSIDSNLMKRIIAGAMAVEEYTDEYFACDANGDGSINAVDSALLKRTLAG